MYPNRFLYPNKIISDNYSVYHCLGEMGWDHEMVNHSMEFIERHDRSVHTEGIEGTSCTFSLCCNETLSHVLKQESGCILRDG